MNLAIILYLLMLLTVLLSIKKTKNLSGFLQELGFARTNLKKEAAFGVLYFLALVGLGILLTNIFVNLGMQEDAQKVTQTIERINAAEVLLIMTVASFVEEIFFRGYLQRRTNILVASAAFSYWHIIYGSFTEMAATFFLGLVLGVEYKKRKNLFAPILSHFAFNVFAVALMYA